MTSRAVALISWCFYATSLCLPALAANTPADSTTVLSEQFLGRPYLANTLGGGLGQPEHLTLRLDGFDCFTFIDTLEAMRRPGGNLLEQLEQVRYHGPLSWQTRNHFFSDWAFYSPQWVVDVTAELGETRRISKILNRKADGSPWLEGIRERELTLDVIAADKLDTTQLQSGDYIGIYTELAGLDVTHVGLAVNKQGTWYLRHASSRHEKVLDEPLLDYLAEKPGAIVLRPIEPESRHP